MKYPVCYYCNNYINEKDLDTPEIQVGFSTIIRCRCGVEYQGNYQYSIDEWNLNIIIVTITDTIQLNMGFIKPNPTATIWFYPNGFREAPMTAKIIRRIPIDPLLNIPLEQLQNKIKRLLPFI